MAHGFKQLLPWWVRVPAKIGLSRLPLPYSFWKSLGLFEHGDMNQPQRAFDTLVAHAKAAGVLNTAGASMGFTKTSEGFAVLELGPGDSLFSAVIAKALGATQTWLVDAGPFATNDMAAYRGLLDFLVQKGLPVPATHTLTTRDALLAHCGGTYLTSGVQALAQLPKASVDFCFSNAVLEHIPKNDFTSLTQELKRVLKPGGVCLHRVDLKDHLGGGAEQFAFFRDNVGGCAVSRGWFLYQPYPFWADGNHV